MKCRPYPKYKPSGIEWLGEVPEHWETGNLRRFASMKTGHTPSRQHPEYWEDCTIPWFTLADVWQLRDERQTYLGETAEKISGIGLANSAAELLPAGTVVFSRTASVGFSGILPQPMATSQDFWNWVCGKGLLPEYLLFLFRAMKPHLIGLTMGSTHKTIYQPDAAGLSVCRPSVGEQEAILRFLQVETQRLETLVEKNQALAEKLKEKRQALISRTVTRGLPPEAARAAGLNPCPNFKPSGIEWIGQVPEHWEVTQLRRKWIILDCKHTTVSFVDEGIPIASIREVHGFEVDLSGAKQTTPEEYAQMIIGGRKPQLGDIIYSRNATVGDAALVTEDLDFCMGQDVCLIRPPGLWPRYGLYLLRSHPLIEQAEASMIGSTFRRINVGQIKGFWACLPPVDEQRAIADYLDRETSKTDHLIEKIEAAIARLQEYRSALITAAVTGKIDVREASGSQNGNHLVDIHTGNHLD